MQLSNFLCKKYLRSLTENFKSNNILIPGKKYQNNLMPAFKKRKKYELHFFINCLHSFKFLGGSLKDWFLFLQIIQITYENENFYK